MKLTYLIILTLMIAGCDERKNHSWAREQELEYARDVLMEQYTCPEGQIKEFSAPRKYLCCLDNINKKKKCYDAEDF